MADRELRLPADVRHIGRSRQWARQHAPSGTSPGTVRVVELLTKVVVSDANPEPPQVVDPSQRRDGGRGMRLVDSLARAWGVVRHHDGKSVWFRVPKSGPLVVEA